MATLKTRLRENPTEVLSMRLMRFRQCLRAPLLSAGHNRANLGLLFVSTRSSDKCQNEPEVGA